MVIAAVVAASRVGVVAPPKNYLHPVVMTSVDASTEAAAAKKSVEEKSSREKAPAKTPEPVPKKKVKPEKAEKPEPVAKEKVKPEKAEKPEPVAKEKGKPAKMKKSAPAAKSQKQKVIIFSHIPLRPLDDAHNLWNNLDILNIIEESSQVVAFINGHNHAGNYVYKNGIHYITCFGMVDTKINSFGILHLFTDRVGVAAN